MTIATEWKLPQITSIDKIYTLDACVDWLPILNYICNLDWLNPITQNYAWKLEQMKQTNKKNLSFTDFIQL